MTTGKENRKILEGLSRGDGALLLPPEREYEARSPDSVIETPQSGERIAGLDATRRDAMGAVQEANPKPPHGKIRHIVGSGDLFVIRPPPPLP